MKPCRLCLMILLVACSVAFVGRAVAQDVSNKIPETGVVLTKLSPPFYPPLARQARISGDVQVRVGIQKDGSVVSTEVISGHPMLKQAALDSAQKSQFECSGCNDEGASYTLTYTFGFYDDDACREVVEERHARSARCLYLWKCSVQRISWPRPANRAPEVTQSPGHVTILAGSPCWEPMEATVAR